MKKNHFLISIFLASVVCCDAQSTIPDPEFVNEVEYYDKANNKLLRLEKAVSKQETHSKMAGAGGTKTFYKVEGEKSTVRVPTADNVSFVFSSGGSGNMLSMMDPSQMISLYKMDISKGTREAILSSYGGMYGVGKTKESAKLTIGVKKIKDGLYEIITDKPLGPGEYSFVMMNLGSMDGSSTMFLFGIN